MRKDNLIWLAQDREEHDLPQKCEMEQPRCLKPRVESITLRSTIHWEDRRVPSRHSITGKEDSLQRQENTQCVLRTSHIKNHSDFKILQKF